MNEQVPDFAQPRTMKDFNGNSGTVAYGMDDRLHATFYVKPYLMEFLSEQLGHAIYQDRIWCRIYAPGNSKTVWDTFAKGVEYDTEVDEETGEYFTTWKELKQLPNGDVTDMQKYPNAWAAFKELGAKPNTGLPIEEWGAVTRSYAESLKSMGIHTVEAMALLSDQAAQSIMGGYKFRELAKAYMSDAERNKIVAREQSRSSLLEDRCNQQQATIEAMQSQLVAMQHQFAQLQGAGINIAAPGVELGAPQPPRRPTFKKGKAPQSARTKQILDAAASKKKETQAA